MPQLFDHQRVAPFFKFVLYVMQNFIDVLLSEFQLMIWKIPMFEVSQIYCKSRLIIVRKKHFTWDMHSFSLQRNFNGAPIDLLVSSFPRVKIFRFDVFAGSIAVPQPIACGPG